MLIGTTKACGSVRGRFALLSEVANNGWVQRLQARAKEWSAITRSMPSEPVARPATARSATHYTAARQEAVYELCELTLQRVAMQVKLVPSLTSRVQELSLG